MLEPSIIVAIILGVVFLSVFLVFTMWKRVPQNKAAVVTGRKKKVISGGGRFVIPLIERYDIISLENIKIPVDIKNAISSQGVAIAVKSVSVVKVKSDNESIYSAVEQFYRGDARSTAEEISTQANYILVGKLREIIAKMTVEEIYRDKDKFSSEVQENAARDLAEMGLEIKAFTVMDISDSNGYLEALGRKQIAEVKKNADIAEAEARKETTIKTAEANRLGEAARLQAETRIAEAGKEKELNVQAFRQEAEAAKAQADLAYEIQANKVRKEVTDTEMQVELLRKQRETELAEQEAERKERELSATVHKAADAEKYRREKQAEAAKYEQIAKAEADARAVTLDGSSRAEAVKLQGLAQAEVIKQQGFAESEAIKAKGLAEAEAMMKKAEAFKQYNDAAVSQMIVEQLPANAKHIAEPIAKTDKIVVIDNGNSKGGGAAKVSGYVTDIIATLPETVEALTGINLVDKLRSFVEGSGAASVEEVVQEVLEHTS
ncbi:MAG: SPFH domain-containing protein [Defluviitaleaceae bacterium]|nr:SPFH domain-containing protein [Defluviitaleaceae bacterium]